MLEVVNWSENLPTIRPKFRHDTALHYHSIFRPWDQNSTMISRSLYAAAFFLMACSTACISSLFLRREVVNLKVLFDINDDISTINKDTTSFFSFEPNMLWILSNLTLMTTYPQSTKPQLPSFPLSPTCNRYYLIACVQNGESICVSRGQGRVINTFNRSWRIK